jgi:hypothetical protein
MMDLDAIRKGLREKIEALEEHLLGPHNHALSTRRHWRWGGSGDMAICVSGPHRGACIDFRDDWRGDPIRLIERERRCCFRDALAWASGWLGIDASYKPNPETERQRRLEREQRLRELAVEDARDNARKTRKAQELWGETAARSNRLPRWMMLRESHGNLSGSSTHGTSAREGRGDRLVQCM